MSPDEKLIYMANQIAAFFVTQGHDKAVAGVADHLNRFWDPRMRTRFLALVQEHKAEMNALVVEALTLIKTPASPPTPPRPR
ncbi:MAG TPA: formate dehydrogenase subunit delta [Rhizomicrobium sp.]|jgi:formate dehydrogenase subunit delta|nr:formate dehydrogenase subunit delta [Rhizomicrobium sp.]